MKVLSLFDGMACGMIAMQLAGVDVESYDAYEIDKYAIKTAQHNFPTIKEHGDVFGADFIHYEGVDFLIGGSPCTYWSIAQTKNRETVASGMGWELFSQYVRALHEAKPKYFIYENNKSMSKAIRASIDETFGFEAVLINSALVSAQNRQRLYWVGKRNPDGTYSKVDVEQPEDRGILLRDILETGVCWREKSCTLDANYYKGGNLTSLQKQSGHRLMAAEPLVTTKNGKSFAITANYVHIQDYPNDYAAHTIEKSVKPLAAEPVCVAERGRMYCGQPQHYEARTDGKTNTLTSVEKDNRVAERIPPYGNEDKSRPVCFSYAQQGAKQIVKNCYSESQHYDYVAEPINVTADGKAQCLRATCYKDGIRNMVGNDVDRKTCVAEPVRIGTYPTSDGRLLNSQGNRIYSVDAKAVTQSAQGGGWGAKTGLYAVPCCMRYERSPEAKRLRKQYEAHEISHGYHEFHELHPRADGKSNTLSTVLKDNPICEPVIEMDESGRYAISASDGKKYTVYEVRNGLITIKDKQYPIKLSDGYYIIRKLTVRECMRLQTVPEWYEFPVSDSQAYKMLGNGWTCEVIAHILKSLKEA